MLSAKNREIRPTVPTKSPFHKISDPQNLFYCLFFGGVLHKQVPPNVAQKPFM